MSLRLHIEDYFTARREDLSLPPYRKHDNVFRKQEVGKLVEWNRDCAKFHAERAKEFAERGSKDYAEYQLKEAEYYKGKYEDLVDNKEKYYIIKS